jgi:hypothetical protein
MVFQCLAVVVSLWSLHLHQVAAAANTASPPWLWWVVSVTVWVAILSTLYSGIIYIFVAARQLSK